MPDDKTPLEKIETFIFESKIAEIKKLKVKLNRMSTLVKELQDKINLQALEANYSCNDQILEIAEGVWRVNNNLSVLRQIEENILFYDKVKAKNKEKEEENE